MSLRDNGREGAPRRPGRVARPARPPCWVEPHWDNGRPRPLRVSGTHAPTFVFLAILVAKMVALADVVIDGSSEIVLPTNAPYATRLAAEELDDFLEGVLGKPLPVVEGRTTGRNAIVLGCGGRGAAALPECGHAGRMPLPHVDGDGTPSRPCEPVGARVPRDRDGYVIEARSNVVYLSLIHI